MKGDGGKWGSGEGIVVGRKLGGEVGKMVVKEGDIKRQELSTSFSLIALHFDWGSGLGAEGDDEWDCEGMGDDGVPKRIVDGKEGR